MNEIKMYTLKDLAEQLKVTERTMHNYIKSGKLKGQKIGGRWQISESNLHKFLNGEA
ncbi:MAG TPA: helix-turn-helix domain-containing protein [Sphaerochaeta sp.]|nr:helix-turn-helix domain-containing protein [Sphaerochaeta sp.]